MTSKYVLFVRDHLNSMPCGVQSFSFRTWPWLNMSMCEYTVCTKPSAFSQVPLKPERFKHPFFSHLKGAKIFASHLALISGSVSRISSTVVRNWLETSPSWPRTLPSRRSVWHSTDFVCSWCKTLFEIWKHPAFLHCGQDKPSFLPLCWDPPCGTDVNV